MARRKKLENAPAPETAAAPSTPPVTHPIATLVMEIWSANMLLGSTIDAGSTMLINQTCLEYELTLKQLAVCAVSGNVQGYTNLLARLNGEIRQREALITNVLNTALNNKLQQAQAAPAPVKKQKGKKKRK